MSDFFITLVSNSSMKIFPENKTSTFTVLLPEKISLKGEWSVAVAEIHYNYNFFNVSEQNDKIRLFENAVDEARNDIISDEKIHELQVINGYYDSVIDLIGAINKQMSPFLLKNGYLLSIDKTSNRTLVHKGYVRKEISHIYLDGRLGLQLGFKPDTDILQSHISPHIGNMHFGVPDQMFIYTDIIDPTFIGHEKRRM